MLVSSNTKHACRNQQQELLRPLPLPVLFAAATVGRCCSYDAGHGRTAGVLLHMSALSLHLLRLLPPAGHVTVADAAGAAACNACMHSRHSTTRVCSMLTPALLPPPSGHVAAAVAACAAAYAQHASTALHMYALGSHLFLSLPTGLVAATVRRCCSLRHPTCAHRKRINTPLVRPLPLTADVTAATVCRCCRLRRLTCVHSRRITTRP